MVRVSFSKEGNMSFYISLTNPRLFSSQSASASFPPDTPFVTTSSAVFAGPFDPFDEDIDCYAAFIWDPPPRFAYEK